MILSGLVTLNTQQADHSIEHAFAEQYPSSRCLHLWRQSHLCLRLDLCRLRQQHPLCDSTELVQDVDECRLQEGLWLIVLLWLALHVLPLLVLVAWGVVKSNL